MDCLGKYVTYLYLFHQKIGIGWPHICMNNVFLRQILTFALVVMVVRDVEEGSAVLLLVKSTRTPAALIS